MCKTLISKVDRTNSRFTQRSSGVPAPVGIALHKDDEIPGCGESEVARELILVWPVGMQIILSGSENGVKWYTENVYADHSTVALH